MTLGRVLEPELMDEPDLSASYDAMDHSSVNHQFVQDLLDNDWFSSGRLGRRVVDIGTGTALIPIQLCRQTTDFHVIANDAAPNMLDVARSNIVAAGMEHRIELHLGDSKQLDFADGTFDVVISNSLTHHLAEPIIAMREMVRVLADGGFLFLRDLFRPDSATTVESLVAKHAAGETEMNRQLLRQSLCAALTLDEIRSIVVQLGFEARSVAITSDRHWTWKAIKGC